MVTVGGLVTLGPRGRGRGKGGGGMVGWAPEDREATIRRLLLLAGLQPSPDIRSFHLAPTTGDEQLTESNNFLHH